MFQILTKLYFVLEGFNCPYKLNFRQAFIYYFVNFIFAERYDLSQKLYYLNTIRKAFDI